MNNSKPKLKFNLLNFVCGISLVSVYGNLFFKDETFEWLVLAFLASMFFPPFEVVEDKKDEE